MTLLLVLDYHAAASTTGGLQPLCEGFIGTISSA